MDDTARVFLKIEIFHENMKRRLSLLERVVELVSFDECGGAEIFSQLALVRRAAPCERRLEKSVGFFENGGDASKEA